MSLITATMIRSEKASLAPYGPYTDGYKEPPMSEQSIPAPTSEQDQVEYRPVSGFPLHRVGSDGSVWKVCHGRWRLLKLDRSNKGGYLQIVLCDPGRRISMFAHALVLSAFKGPRPEGKVCRHLDGNPANNVPSNLEWGTRQENEADKVRHGTVSKRFGERHPQAILTAEQVLAIRRRRAAGEALVPLAEEFGVSFQTISKVARGQRWGYLLLDRKGETVEGER